MITRLARIACAALAVSASAAVASADPRPAAGARPRAGSFSTPPPPSSPLNPFLPRDVAEGQQRPAAAESSHVRPETDADAGPDGPDGAGVDAAQAALLDQFLEALRVMQAAYFEPWLGQWPKAIDWTAAVMGTHVAGALSSLSLGLTVADGRREKENLITTYFSQLISYYFGQDAFAIRNEAYDDMLWVVLGWLEAVQFIDFQTTLYQQAADNDEPDSADPAWTDGSTSSAATAAGGSEELRNQSWYGSLWTPAFSHRARIFWDIASQGWDSALCGGGMNWNPRLEPYKNAITNELFIAASASMYLNFPGDTNNSPFIAGGAAGGPAADATTTTTAPPPPCGSGGPHELKHLQAALAGYNWLVSSGMMNAQGLYADGFHISGWKNTSNPNVVCDELNTMVYTYNQGVVLTGQINLWKVTGDQRFLRDGHRLIQSVIRATGYDLATDRPVDDIHDLAPGQLPPWRGLGRAGVLEEQCDVSGQCSQNSQTFKGIFFHHLTSFCAPLDIAFAKKAPARGGSSSSSSSSSRTTRPADERIRRAETDHKAACSAYLGWIRHNAKAALATKDADGKFGMWWTAGLLHVNASSAALATDSTSSSSSSSAKWGTSSVDYRTFGVPEDRLWVAAPAPDAAGAPARLGQPEYVNGGQVPLLRERASPVPSDDGPTKTAPRPTVADPNSRGRGRTVETQGGGLALLRALWEITQRTAS